MCVNGLWCREIKGGEGMGVKSGSMSVSGDEFEWVWVVV